MKTSGTGSLVSGDTCTVTVTASPSTIKSVGSYTLTVTNLSNSNYAIAASGNNKTVTFTLGLATVTVGWTNTAGFTGVYNGNAQGRVATFSGIKESETLKFTYSMNGGANQTTAAIANGGTVTFSATNVRIVNSAVAANTVTISAMASGGTGTLSNYTFTSTSTEWTIDQKELTFNVTSTAGKTYNGQSTYSAIASANVSGIVGSESISFALKKTAGPSTVYIDSYNDALPISVSRTNSQAMNFCAKDAGTYSVALTSDSNELGFTNTNYKWDSDSDTVAERTFSFTVSPATITLTSELAYYTSTAYTWNTFYGSVTGPANKDNFVYSGSSVLQGYVITPSGIVGTETVSFSFGAASGNAYQCYSGVTHGSGYDAETRRYSSFSPRAIAR